jgi:hypothetical protein
MKLFTLFRAISAGLLVLFLFFSANLIGNRWGSYQCYAANTRMLEGFNTSLTALEHLSIERGYTNTFLGEDLPVIASEKNVLTHIRAGTDDAINAVLPTLGHLPTVQRITTMRQIRLLQQQVSANRKAIDLLLTKDKKLRSETAIANVITESIKQISYIDSTVGMFSNGIIKNNASLMDYLYGIRTTAYLRHTAGQLGSVLIPAIIKEHPLSEQDLMHYTQIKQHINALHLALNQQLTNATDLPQTWFRPQKNRLENNYFRQAIGFADAIASTGKSSGDYHLSSGQFTDMYAANMAAIVQLRSALSQHVSAVTNKQTQSAYALFLLSLGVCLCALLFLLLALRAIHTRMMLPILEAALLLSQPANILYKRTPQPMYKTRDEASSMLLTLYAMRTGTHPTSIISTVQR